MSRILIPEYLLNFARDIYEGPLPSNFGERLIESKYVQVLENWYKLFGGIIPTNQGKRMVPNYLLLFIQNLANAEILEVVDGTIAYIKETPQNALKYAFINKVGGMSYKRINHFDKDTYVPTKYKRLQTNGTVENDSANWYTILDFMPIDENTQYTLSGTKIGTTDWASRICFYDENKDFISYTASVLAQKKLTFTTPSGTKYWRYSAANIENATYDWMLNVGSTSLPYQPYFDGIRDSKVTSINNFAIPDEVQALQGYGQSDPDDDTAYNYIDFDTKEFVRVGYIDNDVWVASALTTDISAYLTTDNIIDASNNLTFNNEYEQAVPSEITYYVRS